MDICTRDGRRIVSEKTSMQITSLILSGLATLSLSRCCDTSRQENVMLDLGRVSKETMGVGNKDIEDVELQPRYFG